MLGDPLAEVPSDFNGNAVAGGDNVVCLRVRHAQAVDVDRFEGDWDWATATLHVRSLVQEEATDRHVLHVALMTAEHETLSLGDADGMLVIPAPGVRTRVIVSTDEVHSTGLETVWIDLVAAEDPT